MKIEKLNWDSDFFGLKIGKININQDDDFQLERFNEIVNNEKYELIYIFKFNKILPKEIVFGANLDLVDIQLTMSKKIDREMYLSVPYDFKTELSEKEKNECYAISEETSVVSRFYNEKKIGDFKTKELYRKWIDNTLNKSFSDGLFLEKELDVVSGIHLIKVDSVNKIGYFTLTGVIKNSKRKGIGKKLWLQSFAYFSDKVEIIKSPFSFQNTESFNFHLKMGFDKIEEIKYIYHFRNTKL